MPEAAPSRVGSTPAHAVGPDVWECSLHCGDWRVAWASSMPSLQRIPWPVGLAFVLLIGYPVFLNVARATLRGKVISHTLMSVGVLGALLIGQWATAAVVVFFMRVGDYAERFTTERGRQAVKELAALPPQTARVERDDLEADVSVAEVHIGDVVVVRPGESIPVDGDVLSGQATLDQAAITGESLPVEVGPGAHVYAAVSRSWAVYGYGLLGGDRLHCCTRHQAGGRG